MQENKIQLQASDPSNSVWVAASAGTGKTKILTDRVVRLLLLGTKFNKILCLTFTNAATNEMEERINGKLKQWSLSTKENLLKELSILLGRKPCNDEIKIAKSLYVDYIANSDNKISIYTIHSFCQKILKKFPIEAGISSSFQILERLNLQQLINKICNKLLNQKNTSNEFLISNFHITTLENIFLQIIDHKLAFKQYFLGENIDFQKAIKKENSNKKILLLWAKQILLEANYYFRNIDIDDITDKKLQTIKLLCEEDININNLTEWFRFFLTQDGQIKKKILNNEVTTLYPELVEVLTKLQKQLFEINEIDKVIKIYNYSFHLLEVAKNFITAYDEEKQKLNYLDFDDLIFYTSRLLSTVTARDWVLYKLDGGIEHILIDESQDTSIAQWEIIKNLIEEFYVGEGASTQNRTIFVVGDEKQSIFSFQGADLTAFHDNHDFFNNQLINIGKQLSSITLEHSYRSLSSILDVVYNVFANIKKTLPHLFKSSNTKVLPTRQFHPGRVELWPIINGNVQDNLFWPTFYNNEFNSVKTLATRIAIYIKKIILAKEVLPSTKRPVEYKDILIIVRKRDDLIKEIIEQLKQNGLPNTGMDRIILNENLSVLDLISIAKFVLNPYDDLNLAELLKSPIFNLDDNILKEIILFNPINSSLWEKLQIYTDYCVILQEFINLNQITDASNFFHYVLDYLKYRSLLVSDSEDNNIHAINELLFMSYNYAKNVNYSLLSFIFWFDENNSEVKCEVDTHNKIRIMTVHNAKGLQAPIVILCDTTTIPSNNQDNFFWYSEQQVYASAPHSSNSRLFTKIKNKIEGKQLEEYFRLLYVALTRAEDVLIICGQITNSKKINDKSWYNVVKEGFNELKTIEQGDNLIFQTDYTEVIIEHKQKELVTNDIVLFKDEITDIKLVKPNLVKLINQKLENNSIFQFNKEYFTYGKILHKIFEDSVKSKNLLLITKHPLVNNLPTKWAGQLELIFNILTQDNIFKNLLKYDVKTELNIGIEIEGEVQIARIDVMIITDKEIFIIDYKSDQNTSLDINKYANSYIKQLSGYYHIIKNLYPKRDIICKIFWLSTAEFITITSDLIERSSYC